LVQTYMDLWPNNPFVFYVPYNDQDPKEMKDRFGDRIRTVKSPKNAASTVLTLLDAATGGAGDKTVYWAIDDYYPGNISDTKKLDALVEYVRNSLTANFAWLALAHTDGEYSHSKPDLLTDQFSTGGWNSVKVGGVIQQPASNAYIWCHGFWKASLLEELFKGKEHTKPGKGFEKHADKLFGMAKRTNKQILRVAEPVISFQETTHRGKIDINAASKLQSMHIPIPEKFLPPTDNWAGKYF